MCTTLTLPSHIREIVMYEFFSPSSNKFAHIFTFFEIKLFWSASKILSTFLKYHQISHSRIKSEWYLDMKIILLPTHFPVKIHILFQIFERKIAGIVQSISMFSVHPHTMSSTGISSRTILPEKCPAHERCLYSGIPKGMPEHLRTNSNSVTGTSPSTGSFTKLSK